MRSALSRRGLIGAGAAAALVATGCRADEAGPGTGPVDGPLRSDASTGAQAVPSSGRWQAGIVTPSLPQASLVSMVLDLRTRPGPVLGELGELIQLLVSEGVEGVQPGDLTVTVGVGPRLVAAVDPGLPGAVGLPAFAREQIADRDAGGDLWVQVCGSDPLVTSLAVTSIRSLLQGRATARWTQRAWRGPAAPTESEHPAPRNVQGFQDGIVAPRTEEELAAGVWIAGSGPAADGTVAVVRRFRIDVAGWRGLSVAAQEAAVGRRRSSSVPLSGPGDPDLTAKTADGRYLVPVDAHVRRAHPRDVGVPMMLRRSYSVDEPDPGLLFISFQSTLRAFVATMHRLDESDAMMRFATATASGSFLVLPGHGPARPLGGTLFT